MCLLCIKALKRLCDLNSSSLGSLMCLSTANLCYGAVADPSFAHGCYSFAIWSSTPSSSGRYYDLCVWNGRGQILERPAGYAYSVRCVL